MVLCEWFSVTCGADVGRGSHIDPLTHGPADGRTEQTVDVAEASIPKDVGYRGWPLFQIRAQRSNGYACADGISMGGRSSFPHFGRVLILLSCAD